jgi:hypothetical protein
MQPPTRLPLRSNRRAAHWLAADGELLAAESALAAPPALSAGLQLAQRITTAIIKAPARSRE